MLYVIADTSPGSDACPNQYQTMVISDSGVMTTLYQQRLTKQMSLRSTVACADEQLSPH